MCACVCFWRFGVLAFFAAQMKRFCVFAPRWDRFCFLAVVAKLHLARAPLSQPDETGVFLRFAFSHHAETVFGVSPGALKLQLARAPLSQPGETAFGVLGFSQPDETVLRFRCEC